jgi:hypothetical protein
MTDLNTRADEIETWWHELAEREIKATVPKALEYGSHDLVVIGRELLHAAIQRDPDAWKEYKDETTMAELGVFFYLLGKMARWTSAIREGKRVSDDTLFDIGIYVRMVQRIRETGQWP